MCFAPLNSPEENRIARDPENARRQTIRILMYVFGTIAVVIAGLFAFFVALFVICIAVIANA